MLHVLIDLRPRLLADAVAVALSGPDVVVEVADDGPEVHDDRSYDVVVVQDDLRASRAGGVTVRIDPEQATDLDRLRGALDWARGQAPPVATQPDR